MNNGTDLVLLKLDSARFALSEAKTIQETKKILDVASAAEILAKRQQLGEEAISYATSIKVEALKQLGMMLKETPKNEGGWRQKKASCSTELEPQELPPTLADMGLDKKTSKLAQDIANLPDKQLEAVKNGVVSLSRAVSNNHISDGSDDWYTPKEIINSAKIVMGSIDLDPASSNKAQEEIMAINYFTQETNGLDKKWSGNVWLNPPYSMPLIGLFITKAINEFESGNITQAIILTNNSTDTRWFHSLTDYVFCLTKGRLNFWNHKGEELGARQGQAIFYLGKNTSAFFNEFRKYGVILKKYDD
jgi:phage N-6-adenine-methyltransferase